MKRSADINKYKNRGGFTKVPFLQDNFLYRTVSKPDNKTVREFYYYNSQILLYIPFVGFCNFVMSRYVGIPFPELQYECPVYIEDSYSRKVFERNRFVSLDFIPVPAYIRPKYLLQIRLMPEFPTRFGFDLLNFHSIITTNEALRKLVGLH